MVTKPRGGAGKLLADIFGRRPPVSPEGVVKREKPSRNHTGEKNVGNRGVRIRRRLVGIVEAESMVSKTGVSELDGPRVADDKQARIFCRNPPTPPPKGSL